jgi:DNA-binding NarL/FixJ family response regulator
MSAQSGGTSKNGALLLVEDDDDARASLGRSLTKAGYSVLLAASVEEAEEALNEASFVQAVVTDVVLGSDAEGGLRLLSSVRSRGVSAPVILITAFAALDNVKRALNSGASFLLEKPFRAAELLEVIERVTEDRPGVLYAIDRALAEAGLTEKELQIARYLLKGLRSAEIAELEQNSDKTVRQHITKIYAKCGVTSRAEFFHYVFAN